MSIDSAILILRLVVGLTISAHGAQKLFGWFGYSGIDGSLKMTKRLRLRPTLFWALMSGLTEFGGGIFMTFGLASPLGAFAVIAAMLMVIITAHWPRSFNSHRDLEFPLVILAVALATAISGSSANSLDALFGLSLPESITLIGGFILVITGIILALVTRLPEQYAQSATPQR